LSIRNSVNPVDYDEHHLLHLVHRVYPNKQYSFWAVLIDKATLRPVKISSRPFARGWHSSSATIIYVSSLIVTAENVLAFAGLDDASTAIASIPRPRLDADWRPIPSAASSNLPDQWTHVK
jgi:hypothetical protein